VLYHSIEKRIVELLTISGKEKISDKHEEIPDDLFPLHEGDKTKRPFIFEK
jgi:hypothetical protein